MADGSDAGEVASVIRDTDWTLLGLTVIHLDVRPPNAVRQRRAAIERSSGKLLLLLDDDVVLESACLEEMVAVLQLDSQAVAVTADFNNQNWSGPTTLWRWYLRWCCGLAAGEWQGRVIGPLLRFGYHPVPNYPVSMDWLGAGNSLIMRSAYESVGGFSDFFLHRCTMNEDVDLGLKLGRVGRIFLCPRARMAHLHALGGRVSVAVAAEDDLFNRYLVLQRTCGRPTAIALSLVVLFFLIETVGNFAGCVRHLRGNGSGARLVGRLRALFRIVGSVTLPK